MDKIEHRSVIKYLQKKGLTPKEIFEDMCQTLGESAPSYATVKRWVADFKRGREAVEDEPRCGRPITASTDENAKKILDLVMNDRRLRVAEIAETIGISYERAQNIITKDLGFSKVSARWVPRLLSAENKRTRHTVSQDCLDLFRSDPQDFLGRFITMDETWVHHYTPESKVQSKQWKRSGSPPPKKAKAILSAKKVMASVFWDCKGVIMVDYLEKGKTINADYYCTLLQRLREEIKTKRPGMLSKKVLFHQDNAPVHTAAKSIAQIYNCGFELLPHPPYSPDLAPSDYHLFPNLKKHLAGRKLSTDIEVQETVTEYFDDLEDSFFFSRNNEVRSKVAKVYRSFWRLCREIKLL